MSHTDAYVKAVNLLAEHANEGDPVNHAWSYICRYCGACSDQMLEHNPDCPFVAIQNEPADDGSELRQAHLTIASLRAELGYDQ